MTEIQHQESIGLYAEGCTCHECFLEKRKYYMRARRGGLQGNKESRKTHCPQGHLYDDENTYHYRNTRQCKTCRKARTRMWWHEKRSNGGSHTDTEWQTLCTGFGNICLRCKRADKPLTKDHILPVSKGGSNDIENLQPLCGSCNASKKDKFIDYRNIDSYSQ